jgi:hypothetical protein
LQATPLKPFVVMTALPFSMTTVMVCAMFYPFTMSSCNPVGVTVRVIR